MRLVVPVRGDPLMGLLVLGFRLFELDLVDLDAVFGVGEAEVDGEGVCVVDVFAFGRFGEDTVFCAGEGLEGAFEFFVTLRALACSCDCRR